MLTDCIDLLSKNYTALTVILTSPISIGTVLDDSDFLPKNTLALTEFDQKQSMGSGGIDIGNSSNTDGDDDIGIRCWIPSPISVFTFI